MIHHLMHEHHYATSVTWTGNLGAGTSGPRAYERSHTIEIAGKPAIAGSSDPSFRGDPARHNPEEMLVAALSACHMLWFLSLCAEAGIVVTEYVDHADGIMVTDSHQDGRFTEVTLRPHVTLAAMAELDALHHAAHARCYIANSVNFPVRHAPVTTVAAR